MSLVKVMEVSSETNVYVVGDLHGCYSLLIRTLREMSFNFNKDLLICVGDLVDRGSESEKCFGLLNEFWFTSIKGNHEDFCWQGLFDSATAFYHKMQNNGGRWFYELPEDIQEAVARRLNDLPILLELNYKGKKYGFVHADVPVQDWELLKELVQNKDVHPLTGRSIIDSCLWSRDNIRKGVPVQIAQVDQVFLGHTVVTEVTQLGNCTYIDTGAVFANYDPSYHLSIIKL